MYPPFNDHRICSIESLSYDKKLRAILQNTKSSDDLPIIKSESIEDSEVFPVTNAIHTNTKSSKSSKKKNKKKKVRHFLLVNIRNTLPPCFSICLIY